MHLVGYLYEVYAVTCEVSEVHAFLSFFLIFFLLRNATNEVRSIKEE
jgi:hypothetical protein